MTLQMALQTAVADEMFSTLNALEGLFSGVLPHVDVEIEIGLKDFKTHVASFVRLFV